MLDVVLDDELEGEGDSSICEGVGGSISIVARPGVPSLIEEVLLYCARNSPVS